MAYVKIRVIRCSKAHLEASIAYAANEAKTMQWGDEELEDASARLEAAQTYVFQNRKVRLEDMRYATAILCGSVETAMREFIATKRYWHKEDGRLAYQIIQSFAPEEGIPPELAHEIGCQFIRELLPGHEAVVGTHLDRAHIHNHIIVNSVSLADGRKAHFPKGCLDQVMRKASDRICLEHGLSVIRRGERREQKLPAAERHYPAGTMRETINRDIRWAARRAADMVEVLLQLQELGYETDSSGFHVKVRPPGAQRFFRLDRFYTEAELAELGTAAPRKSFRGPLRQRNGGVHLRDRSRPLSPMTAMHLRVSLLLGRQETDRKPYIPFAQYRALRAAERQLQFLARRHVRSAQDMRRLHADLAAERRQLDRERYRLNGRKRRLEPVFSAQRSVTELRSRAELTEEEERQLETAQAVLSRSSMTEAEALSARELLERQIYENGRARREAAAELKLAAQIMEGMPAFQEILQQYEKEKEQQRQAWAQKREARKMSGREDPMMI